MQPVWEFFAEIRQHLAEYLRGLSWPLRIVWFIVTGLAVFGVVGVLFGY